MADGTCADVRSIDARVTDVTCADVKPLSLRPGDKRFYRISYCEFDFHRHLIWRERILEGRNECALNFSANVEMRCRVRGGRHGWSLRERPIPTINADEEERTALKRSVMYEPLDLMRGGCVALNVG